MNGFGESFERGMGQGAGLGAQMFRDIQARRAAAQAEAENKRRWEAEMALKERALKAKPANALPPGMRLKQGERYNPETDTVEIIPGSSLYQDQAGKHKKDLTTLQGAQQRTQLASENVDSLLNDPGFTKQFGGYNALASQFFAPGAMNKVETLKANLKAQGLQLMKDGGGIGAISEAEWPVMEAMISKLDPRMSEEDARLALEGIKIKFKNMEDRTKEAYQLNWGNTPFTAPMRTGLGGAPQTGVPVAGGMDQDAKMRRLQELRAKRGM